MESMTTVITKMVMKALMKVIYSATEGSVKEQRYVWYLRV